MSIWKTCMQEVKIAKTELFEGTTCQICTVHCVHLSLQFLFGLSLSESYEIAVCKNKQQKCPHSHKIWLWIFCLMRAISINIYIGMCCHLPYRRAYIEHILNTGSECGDLRWSENGCLKAGALPLPKSSNSGRQPRSSFFPPSHILNILNILNI